jgi:phage-related baseplate assembly protein
MASTYTSINLSNVPAPNVVEQIDYETILAQMIADLQLRDPTFTALVESDPAFKVLEVCAYRETLIRQRCNESARAVMLPYAAGTDLDNLVALLNMERLIVIPEDLTAIPPVAAVYETDNELRRRALLAWESLSTAGPSGAYIYHALSADGDVKDASAISPVPGQVVVTVLSRIGNGTPDAGTLAAVGTRLGADSVRPLTDQVLVQGPTIHNYQIIATLYLFPGPDSAVVMAAAQASAERFAANSHRLGVDVTISGLYAALHLAGVQRVELSQPAAALVMGAHEAAYCTLIQINFGGRNE